MSTLNKAWAIILGCHHIGYEVAATAGKAKAAAYREARSYDSALDFTDLSAKLVRGEKGVLLIEKHEDAGKYWRDTRAFARRQAECDTFNASWPVGTPVRVINCCEADHWPEGVTFTRTPAWAANENSAFVSLDGYAGGFYLKNVVPLVEPLDA